MDLDADFLIRTVQDLVRIESINPSLAEGGSGELEIAAYVERVLNGLGLEVRTHEPEPGRISVVGRLIGSGGGRNLMLNAHLDTVGVEGMPEPFSGEVREGRIYGRGAYDMKGSLGACIAAVKAIVDSGTRLPGDVLIAAVADEEHASIGTTDLIGRYAVDGAIVTEPTALQLCLAHKGFIWLEVETFGRAAHGSQHQIGVDANLRMGRVLSRLERLEQQLRDREPHPLVGPPSLHAATLAGGTGLSTYSDHCRLQIERRTVPGERVPDAVEEIATLLQELEAEDPTFRGKISTLLARKAFEISPDAPIVVAVEEACTEVLGHSPAHVGENPWMDSALLAAGGIETVIIGPTGGGAHAKEEWVEVESLQGLGRILERAARRYCAAVPAVES